MNTIIGISASLILILAYRLAGDFPKKSKAKIYVWIFAIVTIGILVGLAYYFDNHSTL